MVALRIMSGGLPHPNDIVRHSALSLSQNSDVNGLTYNRVISTVAGVDSEFEGDTGLVAPTMVVYYPARTISEGSFWAGLQLGEGIPVNDSIIQAVIEAGSGPEIISQFSQYIATGSVVDFAREASRDGVPLVERRDAVLRQYQAPLAAVAISASSRGYSAVLSTPYFVWPWAAFAEMKRFLDED